MAIVSSQAYKGNRRPPGKLPKDKAKLLFTIYEAARLADEYGLHTAVFLTVNLFDAERVSNALKPVRELIGHHLGNRPFVAVGVHVPRGKVQNHLHIIVFVDFEMRDVVNNAVVCRREVKARGANGKAIWNLPELAWYLAGQENLERTGARLYRSEVVEKAAMLWIFSGCPTLPEYRCWAWPLWVPQEERNIVSFPTRPALAISVHPAIAQVAGQQRHDGRDAPILMCVSTATTSQPRSVAPSGAGEDGGFHSTEPGHDATILIGQHRAGDNVVNARQQEAGRAVIVTLADAFDPETGEIYDTAISEPTSTAAVISFPSPRRRPVQPDLFGPPAINLDTVEATTGRLPAELRAAAEYVLRAYGMTHAELARLIDLSRPQTTNALRNRFGTTESHAERLIRFVRDGLADIALAA